MSIYIYLHGAFPSQTKISARPENPPPFSNQVQSNLPINHLPLGRTVDMSWKDIDAARVLKVYWRKHIIP